MTGLLTQVMHDRADAAGAPDLDLDAIMATGDRRVRRRRVTTGLAAAAVAGVVAICVVVVPGLLDDPLPAPTTNPFAARSISWAVGSTIYWGDQTFDLGQRVRSYVQTDDGFVWTSRDETVHFYDGSRSTAIGTAFGGNLSSDDSGSLVAWTGPRTDDRGPTYVVYDTAARAVVAEVPADVNDDADAGEVGRVMALDGTSTYWRQGDALVRYDVGGDVDYLWRQTPPVDVATKQEPVILEVVDAADGRIAYYVQRGEEWGLAVQTSLDPDAAIVTQASHGVLSPDGRYLASEADDFIAVQDATTGADVSPDLSSYPYAVGFAWVDDDTLMAYGLTSIDGDGPYPADLMTCDIATGCTTVASVDISEGSFALPVGEPLD